MRLLEPTAQIWMKIDPYYQRPICRPMTLVSENIRFMWILAGVPLGGGVKRHWGVVDDGIFGDLGGYVFEKFRDTASSNMWRYATPGRRQMIAKWMTLNDLEWLFHDKMRFRPALLESERLNVWNRTTSRFCGVLCIARSVRVSQPDADALFLCGSWASCLSLLGCPQSKLLSIIAVTLFTTKQHS